MGLDQAISKYIVEIYCEILQPEDKYYKNRVNSNLIAILLLHRPLILNTVVSMECETEFRKQI